MGGFEVLTWGCVYPDSVDFIISLVSSFKVGGHNYALSQIMNNILETDPDYNGGAYELPLSDSLKRSLKLSSDAMYCYGLSREEYRNNMTNEEIEMAMAEFAEESHCTISGRHAAIRGGYISDRCNLPARLLGSVICQMHRPC